MSKIQVVWFRDLTRWDTKNYMNQLQSRFPLKHLREFIIENTDKIKPFDFPQQKFDILGVTNKEGVYFNESLLGSQIKQPYYRVNSGDIFYNPYRVNVGSIGIVPQEFDGKFTSPAYVVFHTKKTELLAEYLVFILKSSWFNAHLRANTKGSVRQNLSFESLCELKIPLPPLEIQNKIVADIHSIQAKIKALQDEEKRLKDEIEAYIYIALGLSKPQVAKKQKVFTVRFKDLERWDTTYNQSKAINVDSTHNAESAIKYPLVALGETILHIDTQTQIPSEEHFCYVGLENIKRGGLDFEIVRENLNTIKSASLILKKGYIYYSKLRPYLKKIFYYNYDQKSYASSELIGLKFKDDIYPKFVLNLLVSNFITQQEQNTSGARMPRVNLNDIKNFKIPLPPLKIQKEIVAFVEQKTAHISNLAQERSALQNSIESKLQKMLTN